MPVLKSSAIFVVTAALAAGCSSTPAETLPVPNGGAGTSAGGSAQTTGGTSSAAGTTSIAGSSSTAMGGAGGSGAFGGGGAGATSAGGTAGSAAGGAGGSAGAAGAGTTGSGGATPVGNLPNQIPAGYTGKPFGGTPQQIPGKIEVERYDTGGNGVAFNAMQGNAFNACGLMRTDATALECTGQPGPQDQDYATCMNYPAGSVYIGYIGGGNYYKYTVDVLQAGTYVIASHAGVSPTNTSVSFAFTADEKTTALTLPSTNGKCTSEAYHVWSEAPNIGTITLTPGHYVLTLTVVNAGLNMDWFAFTKQ